MQTHNSHKFYGAWICPDGQIHWTSNILSHSEVIDELGIREQLIDLSKSTVFSSHEIKHHLNLDLSYIALKIGYIRVTAYYDQLGIQFENETNDVYDISVKQQLIDVCNALQNKLNGDCGIDFRCIIVEQLSQTKYKKYDSLGGFINVLKCMTKCKQ